MRRASVERTLLSAAFDFDMDESSGEWEGHDFSRAASANNYADFSL